MRDPIVPEAAAPPLANPAIGNPPTPAVAKLRLFTAVAIVGFFFVGVPLLNAGGVVPDYKVQLLGKYLCFALVALGADLVWGYTGLLSLCQALFFCVGGYAMAMHMSLPAGGGVYEVPQFLSFVYYGPGKDPLPPFWKPFQSGAFAVLAGLVASAALASVFAFFIFRSRVRGVYFSIITQAVAWGTWLLVCQNEMLLGGTNGLTNFSKAFSQERGWIVKLYLLTAACVAGGYVLCRVVVASRAGRVMVAIRDKEMRLYFAGYKPYAFKVFAFTLAAVLGAVGGMLYPPQVGILTPQNMDVAASIEVVILVAVGGRGRLWGAVFGAVLVMALKSTLSSDLPAVWPFVYGGLFVAVVLFFPDGFVGLWDKIEAEIDGAANPGAIALAAVPVAAVAAFTMTEVLGLWPNSLASESRVPAWLWGGLKSAVVVAVIGYVVLLAVRQAGWLTVGIAIIASRVLGVAFGAILPTNGPSLLVSLIPVIVFAAGAWFVSRKGTYLAVLGSALAFHVGLVGCRYLVATSDPLLVRWKYILLIAILIVPISIRAISRITAGDRWRSLRRVPMGVPSKVAVKA
ncbi:MAG: conserved rane protein of unknown function [Phycisphaerales bacterium]|nr:conserved rane protein of unknown function [Phycisphaerales bacterium]